MFDWPASRKSCISLDVASGALGAVGALGVVGSFGALGALGVLGEGILGALPVVGALSTVGIVDSVVGARAPEHATTATMPSAMNRRTGEMVKARLSVLDGELVR
jgi:hypothetical protein